MNKKKNSNKKELTFSLIKITKNSTLTCTLLVLRNDFNENIINITETTEKIILQIYYNFIKSVAINWIWDGT